MRRNGEDVRPRSHAGFFSSARKLVLPVNERLETGALRGYPIDFRIKAAAAQELTSWRLPATAIQRGLGCYERWLAGQGEVWLHAARSVAEELVARQHSGGRHDGAWLHYEPLAHTYRLREPWPSALPQGEGASLLVRIFRETGDERFADAAKRALRPMQRPVVDGGVCALLDDDPFPEEYPTNPHSYVLNGAIFALWGFHDVAVAFNDGSLEAEFQRRVDSLARNIHCWDTGRWSRYDLFPHPVPNVSSSAYHALHINQLRAMNIVAPRPSLAGAAERFSDYAASRTHRTQAFMAKVRFRLIVPRSPMFSRIATLAASMRRETTAAD